MEKSVDNPNLELNKVIEGARKKIQENIKKQYPEIILRRGMQMAYETLISIAEGYAVMTYKF